MSGYISVRDWRRFQHYDPEKRQPPWIKNYTELMSSDAYLGLTFHQRGLLHSIWLEYAASRCQLPVGTFAERSQHADSNATTPSTDTRQTRDNFTTLSRRLGQRITRRDLETLNHAGFIDFVASKTLADGYQSASNTLASRAPARSQEEEAETEEERGLTTPSSTLGDTVSGNGQSEEEWEPDFEPFVDAVPEDAA